ncbi:hypothetical protein KIPB_000215 [Kipferlia bialata]|uniref:Bromo domain-containing protein n=1 Tax=Kipferlia bialata TaxID=797122 RepID=A0A391NTZ5_9EUKA|nr:hypothetical protein KIPB_000215 [Kipferlia bialata]|eukprot:g215.t1
MTDVSAGLTPRELLLVFSLAKRVGETTPEGDVAHALMRLIQTLSYNSPSQYSRVQSLSAPDLAALVARPQGLRQKYTTYISRRASVAKGALRVSLLREIAQLRKGVDHSSLQEDGESVLESCEGGAPVESLREVPDHKSHQSMPDIVDASTEDPRGPTEIHPPSPSRVAPAGGVASPVPVTEGDAAILPPAPAQDDYLSGMDEASAPESPDTPPLSLARGPCHAPFLHAAEADSIIRHKWGASLAQLLSPVLDTLMESPYSALFRSGDPPLDSAAYRSVVRRPMHLEKVRSGLDKYASSRHVMRDLLQIAANAMYYNEAMSWDVHSDALHFRQECILAFEAFWQGVVDGTVLPKASKTTRRPTRRCRR